jgi:hypothetical protein
MKIAKAKEYFNLGFIRNFAAVACGSEPGFMLIFECDHSAYGQELETALGKTKIYATLDSLAADVDRIRGYRFGALTFTN